MGLHAETCYQALLSRDPHFDGKFFGGVVTTGIYCRPICRVRPPKPENIRWFACAGEPWRPWRAYAVMHLWTGGH